MSASANGNAAASSATKRRKVSTTESTSSRASNKDGDQHQSQAQSISPSRTSTRIAGKERSYSHKYGYGEDESILLLLGNEEKKKSPRKPVHKDEVAEGADSGVGKSKRKHQRRQNDVPQTETNNSTNAPAPNDITSTNSRPRRNRSLDESNPGSISRRNSSKDEESVQDAGAVPERRSSRDHQTKNISVEVNHKQSKTDQKPVKKQDDEQMESIIEVIEPEVEKKTEEFEFNDTTNVHDTEDTDVTTSVPQLEKAIKMPRKLARRGPNILSTSPRRTRTRQGPQPQGQIETKPPIPNRLRKRKPEVTEINSDERNQNDNSVTQKKTNGNTKSPATVTQSTTKPRKYEYPNPTEHLIEELKSSKKDQSVVIEEFRQNKEEQQRVINDLRKHRDEQEKLIEDLRRSRNEKQAEVEKLHAQQRASSILFHRERDAPMSRYLSDNDLSDNEDMGSVENMSVEASTLPSKHPLLFDEIMNKVMSYTSLSDLKNCRLVNKQWNHHASNYFKKKGCVSLKYGVTDFMNIVQTSSQLFPMSGFKLYFNQTFIEDSSNTEMFLLRYGNFITSLKLAVEYFCTDHISNDKLRRFLPPSLPNLEFLVLKLPCKFLSKQQQVPPEEDYGLFLNNTPTKLKKLKVVCQCTVTNHDEQTIAETHFQSGLLFELLTNSPFLESFEFKSGRFDTNRTLLRRVVEVLDTVNLPQLKHLALKGLVLQDLQSERFLPHYSFKSLHISGVQSVENIWNQHLVSLESLTIAKAVENVDLNTTLLEDYVFPNLKELIIYHKIEDSTIFQSFSKLLPNLRKLELHNPTEDTILSIWKDLVQLEEVILDYGTVEDASEKYKILHLDSLLSGFSINNCEHILKKIMKKGLPQDLDFGLLEKFGLGQSVQNMRHLQKLVIRSTSENLRFRITEVGFVLVLLRMKSLTSITINPCVLMKDTMKHLVGKISPAIRLCITCPQKDDNYELAKNALL